MSKQKLLIIQPQPFGYLTDSYKWCEYLKDIYKITVLCQSGKKAKIQLDGIRVIYAKSFGNRTLRGLLFVLQCLLHIFFYQGKILVVYFEHCEILKSIFPHKKILLDIRTLSVAKDLQKRNRYNSLIRKACDKFDYVSVISQGVKEKLKLGDKNVFILPLGADSISNVVKQYDILHLLYVGTFSGRDIEKTIIAVSLFHNQYPSVPIFYDIIGDGYHNELDDYKQLVKKLKLDDIIFLHGRIPFTDLKPFFDKCNIGISFIPLTDYYDVQPPTKTFEYILSGLYTIATETGSNKDLITEVNGILIKDTPEDFSKALYAVYQKQELIDSKLIRKTLECYQWRNIVQNRFISIINSL